MKTIIERLEKCIVNIMASEEPHSLDLLKGYEEALALVKGYDVNLVIPETKWLHNNGNEYKVLLIANYNSTNSKYPKTVVYRGPNGRIWSRLLSDWHRSFTLIGE